MAKKKKKKANWCKTKEKEYIAVSPTDIHMVHIICVVILCSNICPLLKWLILTGLEYPVLQKMYKLLVEAVIYLDWDLAEKDIVFIVVTDALNTCKCQNVSKFLTHHPLGSVIVHSLLDDFQDSTKTALELWEYRKYTTVKWFKHWQGIIICGW